MYTGGTTGPSKAAVQTQRAWAACLLDTVAQLHYRADDRHVVVLPMTHAAWFTLGAHLLVGAKTHIMSRWDPSALLGLVEREQLTTLHMIPTLLTDLLANPNLAECDLSSEGGKLGEIALRGPQITSGYLNRPAETAEAFHGEWFRTGDVGYVGPDGFLYIVDRKKDMIKSGGFNVYPKEVEEVLYQHPAVREAAVVGVPDPKWMEAVVAAVVLEIEAPVTSADLVAYCRERLAAGSRGDCPPRRGVRDHSIRHHRAPFPHRGSRSDAQSAALIREDRAANQESHLHAHLARDAGA
jgi:acyl-CoA synthetase (AMP-forming)/AMP-acid ligase II